MRSSASPNYKRQRLEYLKNRRLKRQEKRENPARTSSPEILSRKKDFIIKRQSGKPQISTQKQEQTQKRQTLGRFKNLDQNDTDRGITQFQDGETRPQASHGNQENLGIGEIQAVRESEIKKLREKVEREYRDRENENREIIVNLEEEVEDLKNRETQFKQERIDFKKKIFELENENRELKNLISELNEETKKIREKLKNEQNQKTENLQSKNGNEVSRLQTDRTQLPPPKLDPDALIAILFNETVTIEYCNNLFATFSQSPANTQQDFLMEIKNWLLDRKALATLQSLNLEMTVNLLLQISINLSLTTSSNPASKKLCGLLIDKLLNCQPQGGMILSMIHLIHLTIPEFTSKVTESEYLLLKFYLNCANKFVNVSSSINAFRFLQLVAGLFVKRPPQELGPSLPSLQIFDEVFRGVRGLSDLVIKNHPEQAKMFYQVHKNSLKDSVFLNYVSNYLIAMEK